MPYAKSSKQRIDLVFVHHKKTGFVETRRADKFTERSVTPPTPLPRYLHYTSKDHLRVCRCVDLEGHRTSSLIALESSHLAAIVTRYLDRHHLEAVSMAEVRACEDQQEIEWAHSGVYVHQFHYASKDKDIVCRCSRPNNHGRGPVRNPEILELCADFFRRNKAKMTCKQCQWRSVNVIPHVDGSPARDSFEYDSSSTQDLLRSRDKLNLDPPLLIARPNKTRIRGDVDIQPGIPKNVWKGARPAMWDDRPGSETSRSTPLGTAISAYFPRIGFDHKILSGPPPLVLSQRTSVVTNWSTNQREAVAGMAPEISPKSCECPPNFFRIGTPRVSPLNLADGITDAETRTGKVSYTPCTSRLSTPECAHVDTPAASPEFFGFGSSILLLPGVKSYEVLGTPLAKLSGGQTDHHSASNTPVEIPTHWTPAELQAEI